MSPSPSGQAAATVHLDARNLRGIAHPVRVRILALLRTEGPATATTLARHLGLNTGATSYHLRQLGAHGFVVEDTERGTARERWWRSAHEDTRLDLGALGRDEEGWSWAYLRGVAELYAATMMRAIDEMPSWPATWRDAATISDYLLSLNPHELRALKDEIVSVISRYRRAEPHGPAGPDAPAGAVPVTLQIQAFPFPGSLDTNAQGQLQKRPGHRREQP